MAQENSVTSKARKLLTVELIQKVEARVKECLVIAKNKWPDKEFEMPEIRYDVKNTHGGLAYGKEWMIRLNLILCYENEEHFIKQTVAHEVAHLIQRRVYGVVREIEINGQKITKRVQAHGPEWKSVMELLGIPADRCHNYDVSSIQTSKRKKRGSIVKGRDTINMLRRLENGVKRLDEGAQLAFGSWLQDYLTGNIE